MKRIIEEVVRPDPELVEGFRSLLKFYSPSCFISDSMERAGVMHSQIKPIFPVRIAGPAITVKLYPGDLTDPLQALKVAQTGDLIVVDACGETETSVWGGLMAGLCRQKGIVGAVIDGAVRDIDEAKDLGFPLFAKAVSPRSTHTAYSKRQEPFEINRPITCGGVIVQPGDIVVADEIGVVVVPKAEAKEILERSRALAAQEERTRERIKAGKTLDDLLQEFGRL